MNNLTKLITSDLYKSNIFDSLLNLKDAIRLSYLNFSSAEQKYTV